MEIKIIQASMTKDDENGYVGKVHFEVDGHREPYEIVLQSKRGREWGYSLTFLGESGPDGLIDLVDDYLDENDDAFDMLVEAARQTL